VPIRFQDASTDAIAEFVGNGYVAIADGGVLSFARCAREAPYMNAGAFGCSGAKVPFAIAAALA
jgi:acetolactate synthase I/II/III large subunit